MLIQNKNSTVTKSENIIAKVSNQHLGIKDGSKMLFFYIVIYYMLSHNTFIKTFLGNHEIERPRLKQFQVYSSCIANNIGD